MGSIRIIRKIVMVTASLLIVGATVFAGEALAVDDATALSPFVNDDTFIAARFDLTALAKTKGGDDSAIFAALPFLDGDAAAVMLTLQGLDQVARDIHKAGVDTVYAVAGLGDANEQGGPLMVFQLRQGAVAKDVAGKLKTLTAQLRPAAWATGTRVSDNAVLVGRPATLDRYANLAQAERADLIDPLGKLSTGGAVFAAVFCPGSDFRRVVRELWPELPGALAPLSGDLADKWRHFELAIDGSPAASPVIALQAGDVESAQLFANLWREVPKSLSTLGGADDVPENVRDHIQSLIEALPANVEGNRVTLQFPKDEAQLDKLRTLARDAADASMESSRRNQRAQRFKEMAVAMLNHESAKKQLPAAAICDEEDKPLLSWRVSILPYMGGAEAELYKQFHLDEAWDSPRNRVLIEKMPTVYADPDPKLNELSRAGKTTYQVPVAPETIFHSSEGTTIRDITDGTSRTISIVEVTPAHAVEWTKPDDWEVDVQKPLEGVRRSDRSVFMAAFADGHIEAIPVNVDFKKLRGLLTRGGSELFDWP